MPRTPKKAARYEPPDFVHAKKKKKAKKKPAPKPKKKTITHTDDGVPIVNASMAQIRKGLSGKAATQLVRIPQVAERGKFYVEAAEIIGERESHALPYHGGRMWKVEVKLSDDKGAYGDNCKGKGRRSNNNDEDDEDGKKKKKTNYNALTPLFRWYRGKLELATMPHILENIEEVEHNQSKAKWARGLKNIDISDDDSSEEEEDWDDDKYIPETEKNFTMEISALTTSAYEDTSHPLPDIRRTWISPDMQRFQSRKSAIAHVEKLTKKDLLIDRVMFGVGHNGVRLRPVKPTRKLALEAGEARFVRDGLWVVGQEEVWIARRREIYVKKQEKWLKSQEQQQKEDSASAAKEGEKPTDAKKESALEGEVKASAAQVGIVTASDDSAKDDAKMEEVVQKVDTVVAVSSEELEKVAESNGPSVEGNDAKLQSNDNQSSDESSKRITPADSVAPTGDSPTTITDCKPKAEDPPTKPKRVTRAPGTRPPPEFIPSTHYCLTQAQIDKCSVACNEHFEKVMDTVKARSLYHELADGFDVMRERGRGRYDMELSAFETKDFSFLTDTKKAAWMPIIHKILGEDALLVHKGCFLSLPGSATQVYHQDGLHLNKKVHKPCHAVNVFIPLIDYNMSNGPTEFCLGTHYLGRENFVKEMAYTPCVTAGTPIIFDYRLGHRGLRNVSEDARPVVYLTYSAVKSGKEFRDEVNFSRKRYKKLGDFVEKKLPRGERLKKRRKVNPARSSDSKQEQNACIGVGSVVMVESRMWPGVNKPGGIGRVTNIHLPEGSEAEGFVKKYDIAYVLGGKEEMVEEEYVSLSVDE
eukprot:CAMPEP_0201723950 /NCGR_PEP_ID=MMETSP0593-20130828/7819_1 /ASSEMBLY_ACC=CAM_ASM_000672 /TAXON_ID=267983 /ORGANISM="Skeletonema japonicum, Strain CCMP2506" /LENGTH=811 /DNA_ID=CAMNT_0048215119 /DNA_START=26 /DNA_END=2461 /DNA_ORIENTATION=+